MTLTETYLGPGAELLAEDGLGDGDAEGIADGTDDDATKDLKKDSLTLASQVV